MQDARRSNHFPRSLLASADQPDYTEDMERKSGLLDGGPGSA